MGENAEMTMGTSGLTPTSALKRETLHPTSRDHWLALRAQDITSTEVSALFGISPYSTLLETWHRHHSGLIVDFDPNERVRWGMRLQDAIALGVAEEECFEISPMPEYMRLPDHRLGSSFDYRIKGVAKKDSLFIKANELLEIKNVDSLVFRDGWIVDGEDVEAPPHIEIQIQQQMLVSGLKKIRIRALVGGNRVVKIDREADPVVHGLILERAALFWSTIEKGAPPEPDYAKDSEFIAKLLGYAEPGKVADLRDDQELSTLAAQHLAFGQAEKQANLQKDVIKAKILLKIGDAEKVLGSGFSITAGTVGPAEVAYHRGGYRQFRVNWPKKKATV